MAGRFYELAKQGKFDQILHELYTPEAKSIEPSNSTWPTVEGLPKIIEKSKTWQDNIQTVHDGRLTGPQVAGNYFTCILGMDFTDKKHTRITFDEVAVYEVRNGKIVTEQFFY